MTMCLNLAVVANYMIGNIYFALSIDDSLFCATHSEFKRLKERSIGELSQQLPRRLQLYLN
jgi:hypothetical protein